MLRIRLNGEKYEKHQSSEKYYGKYGMLIVKMHTPVI